MPKPPTKPKPQSGPRPPGMKTPQAPKRPSAPLKQTAKQARIPTDQYIIPETAHLHPHVPKPSAHGFANQSIHTSQQAPSTRYAPATLPAPDYHTPDTTKQQHDLPSGLVMPQHEVFPQQLVPPTYSAYTDPKVSATQQLLQDGAQQFIRSEEPMSISLEKPTSYAYPTVEMLTVSDDQRKRAEKGIGDEALNDLQDLQGYDESMDCC